MTKPAVALVATPVGDDMPPPCAGIVTTRGDPDESGCPFPSLVVALPDPLSEIQMPLLRPNAIPQGFTKLGSVICAIPGTSETRLVWVNVGVTDAADNCRNMATPANVIQKPKSIRATTRNEFPVFTSTLLGFDVDAISTTMTRCSVYGEHRRELSRRCLSAVIL